MKKLHKKFRNFYQNHREDGNSFLLYIFMVPVICGAVGLGIDTSMSQYIRAGVQSSVDSATVAAAQKTSYSGSTREINHSAADARARTLYNSDRKNYPAITGNAPTIKTSIVNKNGVRMIRMNVKEKSPTVFLHLVGVNEFTYEVVSEARIGSSRQ